MELLDLNEVRKGLWLGSKDAAVDVSTLHKKGITHVLSVGFEFPKALGIGVLNDEELCLYRADAERSADGRMYFRHGGDADPFVRLFISVHDQITSRFFPHFAACTEFIREGLGCGGVLVHCWQGKSRSASVVVAYIMLTERISVAAALLSVQKVRPVAHPNVGFIEDLRRLEETEHIATASPRTATAAGALTREERLQWEMQEICPDLWLGSKAAASNRACLTGAHITHIITVGFEVADLLGLADLVNGESPRKVNALSSDGRVYLERCGDADPFVRLVLDVADELTADIVRHIPACCDFILEGLKSGYGGVLVHCMEGKSRSASVVVGYLMRQEEVPVAKAMTITREKRGLVRPNAAFIDQLREFEQELKIPAASADDAVKACVLTRQERLDWQEEELDAIEVLQKPYDKRTLERLGNVEAELDKVEVLGNEGLRKKRKELGKRCRGMLGDDD